MPIDDGVLELFGEPQPAGWIFDRGDGEPPSYTSLRSAFTRVRTEAELPRELTIHSLRKTTGTMLKNAGIPVRDAQRMLRHSDPRMTMELYQDVVDEDVRVAAAALAHWSAGEA